MTNLYAATGHINYAKSARIYLQLMLDHENTNPRLHQNFSGDLFVVQQSDQIWGAFWPDLAIEQIMMKPLKSTAGPTRGSGFTETVRALCIYIMRASANHHDALSSLAKKIKASEQHQNLGKVVCKIIMVFRN